MRPSPRFFRGAVIVVVRVHAGMGILWDDGVWECSGSGGLIKQVSTFVFGLGDLPPTHLRPTAPALHDVISWYDICIHMALSMLI
jgi:hypothetical protein